MTTLTTISLQEIRKNPLAFLRQINEGKTITVIYHSKPYATVASAAKAEPVRSTKLLLQYAAEARAEAKGSYNSELSFKEQYSQDMDKKYGISRR